MDAYSSGGEDVIIKTRKPYTITKQRERWTEEEHNRFLEALKLYGRAWQRIEEHIGTKTAVQIRSHAQKFFSKLEKEAVAKGVPIGQTLDIDIPPPRPKRKPSNPYPRKTGVCLTISQVDVKDGKPPTSDSFLCCKHVWDLEKEPPPEKPKGDKKQASGAEIRDDNCSEVFSIARGAQCSSVTAANKNSTPTSEALNSCSFREVVPSLKEVVNQNATNDSYVTIELEGNRKIDKTDAKQENSSSKTPSLENSFPLMQQKISDYLTGALPADDMQAMQNYPRHVPVHVVDGSLGTCMQTPTSDMSFQDSIFHPIRESHGQPNLYVHPAASVTTEQHNNAARSSTHRSFMTFPPFPPTQQNQDDYRSFLQMSSTFSSLIVSALLQNPAAHAAASFWPYINMENSADSPACSQGGFPPRQMISAPSMAAITTATVAAATAWWAAHGLLPLCAPLYAAFACPPTSALPVPSVDVGQVPAANPERKENILENPPLQDHQLDPEHFEALPVQNSASKAPTMSTSDSGESGVLKTNSEAKPKDHEMVEAAPDVNDLNKTKSRKQVDRSSCGSNTPYSSEVETDALEKHAEGKEESKEADANHHPAGDSSSRRSRSSSSLSDSRKEVSEEGRLAFQALFSREVLPQSFSPPHDLNSKKHHNSKMEEQRESTGEKGREESLLDLNNQEGAEKSASPSFENNRYDGLLTIGLGHGKLKARRTGFIPYKRCSVEAKASRGMTTGSQGEEQCPKRIRLEGEAST